MREPLNQIKLMQIVMGMKPGECIQLSSEDLRKCAEGSLNSLFDSVRESDITEFLAQISDNWEVSVRRNPFDGTATLTKGDIK